MKALVARERNRLNLLDKIKVYLLVGLVVATGYKFKKTTTSPILAYQIPCSVISVMTKTMRSTSTYRVILSQYSCQTCLDPLEQPLRVR
jgi:hypothetical protein